jgi:hypothetical protein
MALLQHTLCATQVRVVYATQETSLHLSTREDPATQKVIDDLSIARERSYLTKPELVKVCRWKSPRALKHIQRNQGNTIKKITKAAFGTRSEEKKLALLITLYGVSIPMASSILMLTNPNRYGVIDIRVWQLLFEMGTVKTNADGIGFDFKQWYRYLVILRYLAKKYKVGARDIERTLFRVHGLYQKGTLYSK